MVVEITENQRGFWWDHSHEFHFGGQVCATLKPTRFVSSAFLVTQRGLRWESSCKVGFGWSIKVSLGLHQHNWCFSLLSVWPLRSCKSLPIPPLTSSGIDLFQPGPSSSTIGGPTVLTTPSGFAFEITGITTIYVLHYIKVSFFHHLRI